MNAQRKLLHVPVGLHHQVTNGSVACGTEDFHTLHPQGRDHRIGRFADRNLVAPYVNSHSGRPAQSRRARDRSCIRRVDCRIAEPRQVRKKSIRNGFNPLDRSRYQP